MEHITVELMIGVFHLLKDEREHALIFPDENVLHDFWGVYGVVVN